MNRKQKPKQLTLDEFWEIVENVHRASDGNMDKKCELLDAKLRRLTLEQVRSFQAHFDECQVRAYFQELWDVAASICGGCSDDGFSDFRSTLISMGRETFERALANPQWLIASHYGAKTIPRYEGYQYVPTTVETDLGGGDVAPSTRRLPDGLSGKKSGLRQSGGDLPKLGRKV